MTIAGSDSGGGAGIQADIKTFQELNVFGMSAITAITVQNTLGVQGVYPIPVAGVAEQIQVVGSDLGVDALKTGMLFNAEIIEAVTEEIKAFGWKKLVVDPVMVAKGGAELLCPDAASALKQKLLPLAMIVTPNIPEAEVLAGKPITTWHTRCEAAKRIADYGVRMVVIKGGHDAGAEQSVDLLYDGNSFTKIAGPRIATRHTHGTGCTFSAAIAAQLAKGASAAEAVHTARSFIQAAIEETLNIGAGNGPTNHWAYRRRMESAQCR
ncbi:bifunctional hydroxymethylpyrimidine kinase/phosphomethylpyrimidine kinase [Paenibacillus sp.]|jgi:hydroxymethylpyrimidine/phosphomethylpyrimidine kinase|uniref:bifunctional hydroxymethylpyrimidine kinase/phosphomethylpyrimidine kinase n=1 Tax=Paenibacillus sp. TaxID=58172 RepID=UPI00283A916E|nr:bifunctional hydroxymethylpyrimidine kinase/phosphomethylpyrimidine kinase [Paenibacillus sp.]